MSTVNLSYSPYQRSEFSFTRRGHSAQTPSSAAADEALRHIVAARRMRHRSGGAPRPGNTQSSSASDRLAALFAGSPDMGRVVHQAFKVVVLGAVAIILATATIRIVVNGPSLAGVAGTVRIGNAPLAHGILEFHLKNPPDSKASFRTAMHTDASGAFHRAAAAGLPRGTYAVVVKARPSATSREKQASVVIPDHYAAAASTPLTVEVTGASATFDLVVRP